MASILVVSPNPLVDHIAEGGLRPGQVRRVARLAPIAGGKAFNTGRLLVRLGHRVTACGFAGGSSGEALRGLLAEDGMAPALTQTRAATRIGFEAVDVERGEVSAVFEGGFAVTPGEAAALLDALRARIDGQDLVIAGGSVPDDSCRGLYRDLLDETAARGVPCWLDAYGPAMEEALAGRHLPSLCKPNREEAAAHDRWAACPEVHVTDGENEIAVRSPDGRLRVRPPRVRAVNAIGSGDCYLAGLAHARLSGMPLVEQLRWAAAAGSANAARLDIARFGAAEIAALLDEVTVTPLA